MRDRERARRDPSPDDVRRGLASVTEEIEARGADSTRWPEQVGSLIDLRRDAERAKMPPRVVDSLIEARRSQEKGQHAACLRHLADANRAAATVVTTPTT